MNKCIGCGLCCIGHITVGADDSVPKEYVHESGKRMKTVGKICSALDRTNKVCIIYPNRPRVCRDFEVDGKVCLRLKARAAPGA